MRTAVGVGVAGALGALARYGVDSAIERHGLFPSATFVVNLTGAFVLGLIFVLVVEQGNHPQWLKTSLTLGLLGAYTTFSTLSYDTLMLIEWRAYGLALPTPSGASPWGLLPCTSGARWVADFASRATQRRREVRVSRLGPARPAVRGARRVAP